MRIYKQNLGLLNSRYGELERRLLDHFAKGQGEINAIEFANERDFDFYFLMRDELLVRQQAQANSSVLINGVQQGPWYYVLTPEGEEFLARWVDGKTLV